MADFFAQIAGRASMFDVNIVLFLGIILFGGAVGGRLFQKLKVPQVVGYIIIGTVLGQSGLKFIGLDMIKTLQPVSTVALSLIGFSIGGELKIAELKKRGKQFVSILFLEAFAAFLVVSALVIGLVYLLTGNLNTAIELGIVLGSISSATAPAATTDVLWENRTRGPLTSTVLGIVAMDDAVALLLFAFAVSIASTLIGGGGAETPALSAELLGLLWEIGGAIIAGALIALILSKLIKGFVNEERILAFSIGAIMLLSGLAKALDLDMILAAMSMGFFISNFAPRKADPRKAYRSPCRRGHIESAADGIQVPAVLSFKPGRCGDRSFHCSGAGFYRRVRRPCCNGCYRHNLCCADSRAYCREVCG